MTKPVIDHLSIQARDLPKAAAFYDAVLGTLGFRRVMDFGELIGYGNDSPQFWVSAAQASTVALPPHFAFVAETRDAVRAFFAAAVATGAEVLHEPQVWAEYHEHYYGAFVRDPDGNNVEACCHRAE